MSVVKELLRTEKNGSISFGNYELDTKSKLADFEYKGDLYKVKTFKEITKLERNGMFVYESVPGTAVCEFTEENGVMKFDVEGLGDAQVTVEAEAGAEYKVYIENTNVGKMKANLGGKLVLSVELESGKPVNVKIVKM